MLSSTPIQSAINRHIHPICALVMYTFVVILYRYVTNVIAVQFSMSFCHTWYIVSLA